MYLIVLKFIILPLVSPLFVGIIRRIKAYTQNRQGTPITQPYFDLWKLFHKDEVIAKDASWIFRLTPFFIFSVSLLLPLGVPFLAHTATVFALGDFLVIVYLLALMTFFLALAGMDTGSMFGGFGASREMMLAALTEGSLLFSIVTVALITHATNFTAMTAIAAGLPLINFFPILIAFLGFFIALMAETGRIPFDNEATHLELTMIHEAMILEYSGKRLALIEWANANKFLFFLLLGANLFFPWGLATTLQPAPLFFAATITIGKIIILTTIVGILESSIAKFRLFRLPDLLLTGFIFCVIALIATVIY